MSDNRIDVQNNEYIIQAEHLTKIYGVNKQEAARMMAAGKDKNEVFKETGATVALWDVSF